MKTVWKNRFDEVEYQECSSCGGKGPFNIRGTFHDCGVCFGTNQVPVMIETDVEVCSSVGYRLVNKELEFTKEKEQYRGTLLGYDIRYHKHKRKENGDAKISKIIFLVKVRKDFVVKFTTKDIISVVERNECPIINLKAYKLQPVAKS